MQRLPREFTKICVMGLGYIGLPTASILASKGYDVLGVDVSERVVATINRGKIHIEEPGLDMLVRSATKSGRLRAATAPEEADVFFICVPTPLAKDKTPDLSYVQQASEALVPVVRAGNLVILESTSPPGTTENLVAGTLAKSGLKVGDQLHVAHAPERVLPGDILREAVENDRIIGGIDGPSTEIAARFYDTFVGGEIVLTNARTAELSKLTENAFRDVNIAFANELSRISDRLGVNVWELIDLANRHPRVQILQPGPGVGGHCIAVDPWFIVHAAPAESPLIRQARAVNDDKPDFVVERIRARAERILEPVIACLGLTYKADVDDLRESPALAIARRVRDEHIGTLLVAEPHVAGSEDFDIVPVTEAIRRADIVVTLVGHRDFRRVDPETLKEKILIDVCGLFNDDLHRWWRR